MEDPRITLASIADSALMGQEVDKSLAQTARAGLSYATVPLPWIIDWWRFLSVARVTRFAFQEHCGLPGWDFNGTPDDIDGDGNVNLCLLPAGHHGLCGSPRVAARQP